MNKYVLNNFYWSFIGSKYSCQSNFEHTLIDYQVSIQGDEFNQESLYEPVIIEPSIRVKYWCYEGETQIEPIIQLSTENGLAFTALELIYQLHNAVVEQLNNIDHHFFEGLELLEEQDGNQPTLYKLRQGS